MLYGKAKITLTDVSTGEETSYEQTNMVTNAVKYLYEALVANNKLPNDYMLPLYSKGLGCLMLFDDELTENVENIYFPGDAKIVGYGGRSSTSSYPMVGSLSTDSGEITNGYKNIWDFTTTQCNGTISSLSLTNYKVLNRKESYQIRGGSYGLNFMYRDGYYYSVIGASSTSWKIYKVKSTDNSFGVNISAGSDTAELVATVTVPNWTDNPEMCSYDADYIYLAKQYTESNTGKISYFTIKYSDLSFTVSSVITLTCSGVGFYDYMYAPYANNKFYCIGSDTTQLHIVNKDDVTDTTTITTNGYTFPRGVGKKYVIETNNGIIYVECQKVSDRGKEYTAIIYPDNTYKIIEYDTFSINNVYYNRQALCGVITSGLDNEYISSYGDAYVYNNYGVCVLKDYLGTICNLETPIVKDSTKTMRIEYSITDTDDADE